MWQTLILNQDLGLHREVLFDAKDGIWLLFNEIFSGLNSKWFDNGDNVTYDVDMMQYKKL